MINFPVRYRQPLLLGSVTLVALAWMALVILPLFQTNASLTDSIYDSRIKVAIAERERHNLVQTQLEYNKIKNDLQSISRVFIQESALLDQIAVFESIATATGVEQNLAIHSADTSSSNATSFDVTVTGAWADCLEYLGRLERQAFYVIVENPEFVRADESITLTFRATTYADR